MVSYMVADVTVTRYPWAAPTRYPWAAPLRLDGTEVAFCFNSFWRRVSESYVGWPETLLGWMGKLLVKVSVEGTEEAMVAVMAVTTAMSITK
jgi:hypothetical protein